MRGRTCKVWGALEGGYDERASDGSRRLGPVIGSTLLLHHHHHHHTASRRWASTALGRRGETSFPPIKRASAGRGGSPVGIFDDRSDKCQQSGEDDNDCIILLRDVLLAIRPRQWPSSLERFINPRMTPSPRDQRSSRSKEASLAARLGTAAPCPCLEAGRAMSPPAADAHQSPAASAKRPGHGRARAEIAHAALHIRWHAHTVMLGVRILG